MNTALLRLSRRDPKTGVRRWTVPGFTNAARLVPERHTPDGWGAAFHWPATECYGAPCDEMMKGVDLGRHRKIARAAARAILDEIDGKESSR